MSVWEGILLGIVIGAVLRDALVRLERSAPMGWEDSAGWHAGIEPMTPLERRAAEDQDPDVIAMCDWSERNHHHQRGA
jgi:hypothetical protein